MMGVKESEIQLNFW